MRTTSTQDNRFLLLRLIFMCVCVIYMPLKTLNRIRIYSSQAASEVHSFYFDLN